MSPVCHCTLHCVEPLTATEQAAVSWAPGKIGKSAGNPAGKVAWPGAQPAGEAEAEGEAEGLGEAPPAGSSCRRPNRPTARRR